MKGESGEDQTDADEEQEVQSGVAGAPAPSKWPM